MIFSNFGVGPLGVVEGTVNAKKYIEVLKGHLVPT